MNWCTYTTADGLMDNRVYSISEDTSGNLWFGTRGGANRYDGRSWARYDAGDGLASGGVFAILEDRRGELWFATQNGVTRYVQDRIPPKAVVFPPFTVSGSPVQTITFLPAFREYQGINFSHSFDGSPWTEWSMMGFWQAAGLADGAHVFKVRARDKAGNVDSAGTVFTFETDATAPTPHITGYGGEVTAGGGSAGPVFKGAITIIGTAADPRFERYRVEARPLSDASWDLLAESNSPVVDGRLCEWNTLSVPDGGYEVRVSETDTLGLTGRTVVRVTVDNHAPWAAETAPTTVSVISGGYVYSTHGEVRIYFTPYAFARETEVDIIALEDKQVPDTLWNGAVRVSAGYEILWGDADLEKSATLDMNLSESGFQEVSMHGLTESLVGNSTLILYISGTDFYWRRLGGTCDASVGTISVPLTEPGRYAVFLEGAGVPGLGRLSDISVIPRAFSPRGGFAGEEVAVGFTLGRPGPVTVKVYNRAGRLVREIASDKMMNAGANLVRWDGRSQAGDLAEAGLYLVSVEASGEKRIRTLALVR
jgi:hypothetical protein